ncbi:MAG: glutamine--fructose-6-phosphate transaminase (isomerizing) [Endomicrobium sp.]|jgi:glucosamine--fructose-6-phosphate aminotransferase (isomerizing)|nr:glutamine--fructose-6-phosphate transaminase (isomerizing) [Endomicrobium sp.]
MCGIVGYIGKRNSVDVVLYGLGKLEYRGYDSSGIAVVVDKKLQIRKKVGRLYNLKSDVLKDHIIANVGLGHTRWATHGKPSEINAHPHVDSAESIVIVHNGIVENYVKLRSELLKFGQEFKSETDSEVIVHLIKRNYKSSLFRAVQGVLSEIKGSYALGVLCKYEPDKIVCARQDAPLVIGIGKGENFVASDVTALLPYTRNMIFLEDGDVAEITSEKVIVRDIEGNMKNREIRNIQWSATQTKKDGYKHFMLKEIFEQPQTLKETLRCRIYPSEGRVRIEGIEFKDEDIKNISNIHIVACGTSYHAGLVSKFLFENFTEVPTEVDIASEFRYGNPILNEKSLVILVSQSGETADTLAALKLAKSKNCMTLAVCNVVGSSISREAEYVIYTRCGPEIGVASTKTFTSQLAILYMLAFDWANKKGKLAEKKLKEYLNELYEIPLKISKFLNNIKLLKDIAKVFVNKRDFLYVGRHVNYPVALEGALKLKEISYIHAEGYAAGEMKHGPIALIDESMPVVAIAVKSRVYEKIISNIEEAKSRGGTIVALASECDEEIVTKSDYIIYVPKVNEFMSPFVTVVPLQLLAYYVAVLLGCDVDQPRNLAKSVTVE